MAVKAIDGKSYQLTVQRLELLHHVSKGDEFGGADRREVGGMAEKDFPFATEGGREVDLPLGGVGGEFGSVVADAWHGMNLFLTMGLWQRDDDVSMVVFCHFYGLFCVFHSCLVLVKTMQKYIAFPNLTNRIVQCLNSKKR